MCGISGLLFPRAIAVSNLGAVNTLIRRRGPDDKGYVLFSKDAVTCLTGSDMAQGAMPKGPTLTAEQQEIIVAALRG